MKGRRLKERPETGHWIHLVQILKNTNLRNTSGSIARESNLPKLSGIQLSQILMNTSCSSFEEYILLKLSGMKIIRNTSCSNERRLCLNSSLLEWSRHHNIQNVLRFQHVLNILDVSSWLSELRCKMYRSSWDPIHPPPFLVKRHTLRLRFV